MTISGHMGFGAMKEIQLKDAKATLSAVVDRAIAGEPAVITRHGRKEAVLVSFEEWERVSKVPSFADLLLAFPGEPGDIPKLSRKPARTLRDPVG
jgi:antitoxin Phd